MSNFIKKIVLVSIISAMPLAPVSAVQFGIFGDVSFSDSDAVGENNAFSLGAVDFFATHEISDNSRVFIEYVFEQTDDGLVTDLERLWVSRKFNDSLSIAVGRFHTPLGSWNRTFHHGALIQDTVSRPFFLDFEDGDTGVLPTHIVGLMTQGNIELDNSTISYEISIGNGSSIDTAVAGGFAASSALKPEIDINATGDANSDKSVAGRVVYSPDDYPVQIGIFGMYNTIAESAAVGAVVGSPTSRGDDLVAQNILGIDVLYEEDQYGALVELYQINNENKVGPIGDHTAIAWYAQFHYQATDAVRAIYRHESLSFDAADSYFRLLGTSEATHDVIALRYDMDETNALKAEINRADPEAGPSEMKYSIQWAFLFQ